jgi:hypothetical protein
MKRLTGAQVFAGPRNARNAKARLERAIVTVAAAREQAVEVSQQRMARVVRVRPTMWHRRRLAQRLKSLAG